MKLIIAGSRHFNFYFHGKTRAISTYYIDAFLEANGIKSSLFTEVVCGCGGTDEKDVAAILEDVRIVASTGMDQLGEYWGYEQGKKITHMAAKWSELGKKAGPIRNEEMAKYGDMLLLIWDGESRGSANMKMQMQKLNKPIIEVILKQPKTFNLLFKKNDD